MRRRDKRERPDTDQIVTAYLAGEDMDAIAKKFGIKKPNIYRCLRYRGVEHNRKHHLDHWLAKLQPKPGD
jgi:uncharacterized protein (DUF433 family)